MANKNQIELANFLKSVHDQLREKCRMKNADLAWTEHLQDSQILEKYSKSMQELAILWEENSLKGQMEDELSYKKKAQSRIEWIAKEILNYFKQIIFDRRKKEIHLLNIWFNASSPEIKINEPINKINVLDVGSCYNPLKKNMEFNVTAVDLYPNKELEVFKCDFLKVEISDNHQIDIDHDSFQIKSLPSEHYDCVIFSLYLEYIPTSLQRIQSCQNAYNLLKYEGILIIVTPDSEHVGKNAKLMKNWRYVLAKLGFLRIKFEKLHHLTCMVYRKAINSKISCHWSKLHKEKYMTFEIEIPQDKKLLQVQ